MDYLGEIFLHALLFVRTVDRSGDIVETTSILKL